jgi:Fe-S-cluster containining protein
MSGKTTLACRDGCGACCIAISISSPIPGMPHGKPAGVRCPQLTGENRCALFGRPERPRVCSSFPAMKDVCGGSPEEAFSLIELLEVATAP